MRLGLKGTSPTVACVSLTGKKKKKKHIADISTRASDTNSQKSVP
jgi:hypothetical protein